MQVTGGNETDIVLAHQVVEPRARRGADAPVTCVAFQGFVHKYWLVGKESDTTIARSGEGLLQPSELSVLIFVFHAKQEGVEADQPPAVDIASETIWTDEAEPAIKTCLCNRLW